MTYSGRHPWDADDPYPDDYPECDHVDYEADILTGEATCACGHRWMQTCEELAMLRQMQADYDRQCEQWDREQRSWRTKLGNFWSRVRQWWKPAPVDEVPF